MLAILVHGWMQFTPSETEITLKTRKPVQFWFWFQWTQCRSRYENNTIWTFFLTIRFGSHSKNHKMTSFLDAHTNSYDRSMNSSSAPTITTTTPKTPIDYRLKANQNLASRFVFECAIKLNMKPLTSATAANILHRFNREVESENYDDFVSDRFSFPSQPVRFNSLDISFFSWLLQPRCIWPENWKTIQLKYATSSMLHTLQCIEVNEMLWARCELKRNLIRKFVSNSH